MGRWPFYIAILFSVLPVGAGADGAAEGSTLRQIVWASLFLASALVLARIPDRVALVWRALSPSLLLLIAYVFASVLWSPEPFVSFKRAIQVLGVLMIASSLIAGGQGTYRIHQLVPPILLCAMAFAVLVTAVFPHYAFSELGFRGFMSTKNTFGQFAVFAVFFAAGYIAIEKRLKLLYIPLALLGLAGLALSRSATSILALVAVVAILAARWAATALHPSWRAAALGIGLLVVALAHFLGIVYGYPGLDEILDTAFAFTGRESTLTGRTYLWELMVREIEKHPWFGTGYGGFWLGLKGMSGQIAYLVKWGYPGQAHNGYLDILNELGAVGLILVFAFLGQHLVNVVRLASIDTALATFHGTLLVLLVALNFAEATILRTTHLWWIVFTASVLEVAFLTRRRTSQEQTSQFRTAGVP